MKHERPIAGAVALIFLGLLIGLAAFAIWRSFGDGDQAANDAILDARAARGDR